MLCESWRVWRSQVSNQKAIRNDIWSIWEWSKVIWRGIWARFETVSEKTKNNNSEWYICGLRVLISNARQRGLQIDRVLSQNRWDWILGDLEMTYKRSASHGDAKWAYLRSKTMESNIGIIWEWFALICKRILGRSDDVSTLEPRNQFGAICGLRINELSWKR